MSQQQLQTTSSPATAVTTTSTSAVAENSTPTQQQQNNDSPTQHSQTSSTTRRKIHHHHHRTPKSPISEVPPPTALETIQELLSSCSHLSFVDLLGRSLIVLSAWTCMCMMLFGMNFMLSSFKDSRQASYTALISTGLAFLVVSTIVFIIMLILTHYTELFRPGKSAFRHFFDKKHLGMLALLGFVDCCGGYTGTYGAPNTPIPVQFTMVGASVVWTFLLAKWLVPDRDRPCTMFVFVSVSLTVLGAGVTIIPQWSSWTKSDSIGSTIGWITVYFGAAVFPLSLNVLYSKYLIDTVDHKGKSVIEEEDVVSVTGGAGDEGGDVDDGDDDTSSVSTDFSSSSGSTASSGDIPHNIYENSNNNNNNNNGENQIISPNSTHSSSVQQPDERQLSPNNNDNNDVGEDRSLLNQSRTSFVSTGSKQHHHHHHHRAHWPYFVARLSIALFGDACFQIIFILILMPLDFTPWFGASDSANQTITWLREGLVGVFDSHTTTTEKNGSENTPAYYALYFLGFYFSHIIGASLSYYSPQLTAFIYSINTPINLLCLVAFPSFNVFGLVSPMWASLTSIAMTAIGAIMYASWEHSMRKNQHDVAVAELEQQIIAEHQQQQHQAQHQQQQNTRESAEIVHPVV